VYWAVAGNWEQTTLFGPSTALRHKEWSQLLRDCDQDSFLVRET
jgi:hypothetical protein